MGRRGALWLVLPVLGLVLACAHVPAAEAYTYVVRPNATLVPGSWTVVPSGSIDSVLDDNVLSPTAPSTWWEALTGPNDHRRAPRPGR